MAVSLTAKEVLSADYNSLVVLTNGVDYTKLSDAELVSLYERSVATEEFYNGLQQTVKLNANGMYGALGSSFFKYTNTVIAADITAEGRNATRLLDRKTNEFFDKWHITHNDYFKNVIKPKFTGITFKNIDLTQIDIKKDIAVYGDTDSLFIEFTKVLGSMGVTKNSPVRDICDLIEFIFVDLLQPLYAKALDHYATYRNCKNHQEFELEQIMRRIILCAKKKYVGSLLWKDGVYIAQKKQLKIGGLELRKKGTSVFAHDMIQKFIMYMLTSSDCDDKQFFELGRAIKNEFRKQPVELWATGWNMAGFKANVDIDAKGMYTHKPTANRPGVRGLCRYNNEIIKRGLQTRYPLFTNSGRYRMYYDESGEAFCWPGDEDYPSFAPKASIDINVDKNIFDPVRRLLIRVTKSNVKNLGDGAYTRSFC